VSSGSSSRTKDGLDFLRLASTICLVVKTIVYPLDQANQALAGLRAGRFEEPQCSCHELSPASRQDWRFIREGA